MGSSVPLRDDYCAADLRGMAKRSCDNRQIRRLLALAAVYDGMIRTQAARIGGMDRQTLRDWVHRFNELGPDGLTNAKGAGRPRSLNDEQMQDLAQIVETGPDRELSKNGIIVVILPLLPGTFLDGAVMSLNGKTPVIGLTLRHDRIDNFWFTLLHELSHLAKHFEVLSSSDHVFFDELDIDTEDEVEAEADSFAKNCLVPSKHARVCKNKFARTEQIEKASEEAGVHVSIVAGRWQKEHGDYKKFSRLIERNTVRDMLQGA